MLEQGESTTFADVCVVAGGTVMPVHGAILASRYSSGYHRDSQFTAGIVKVDLQCCTLRCFMSTGLEVQ